MDPTHDVPAASSSGGWQKVTYPKRHRRAVDGTSNSSKRPVDVGPIEEARRWIEYAAGEASELKKTAFAVTGAGLSQFLSAASASIEESKGLMELAKSQYEIHEELNVAKIKEEILIAALHTEISCGAAAGLGLVVFKSNPL